MKRSLFAGIIIIAFILAAGLFSCVANSEEDLYGIELCDTANVTWESHIQEILQSNCVPWHNPELHYNDVRHDTYSEELKVVDDGRLRGVVNHRPGFPQMPYQLPQLPECERQLINLWLDKGAPEK